MRGQPIQLRTLIFILIGLVVLFAATSTVAGWYERERVARARAAYVAGTKLAAEGRYEEAIDDFRSALTVSRESSEYRLALARSLMALGRRNEAAVQLREVLRAAPEEALPHLLLARIAAEEGRTQEAVYDYQRAIYGYWPSRPEANRLNAQWELVHLLAKTGQRTRVIGQLLGMAEETVNDLDTQKQIAQMLIEYGAPAEAAAIARNVITRAPRDFEARSILGRAEMDLGEYALARDAFRRALLYNPQYEPARTGLATATEVLSLDPTQRGLSASERLRRSRELVTRALSDLEQCTQGKAVPPEMADVIRDARVTLAARAPNAARATERNIATAETLWRYREDFCGPAPKQPVARVLSRIPQ